MSHYEYNKDVVATELNAILYNSVGMFSKVGCTVYFDYYRHGETNQHARDKMLFNQLRNLYMLYN